jgi:hypothetical protein
MAVTSCSVIPMLMLRIDVGSTRETICGLLQLAAATATHTDAPMEIRFTRLKALIVHRPCPHRAMLTRAYWSDLDAFGLHPGIGRMPGKSGRSVGGIKAGVYGA